MQVDLPRLRVGRWQGGEGFERSERCTRVAEEQFCTPPAQARRTFEETLVQGIKSCAPGEHDVTDVAEERLRTLRERSMSRPCVRR